MARRRSSDDYARLMPGVARLLLGEPNAHLSSARELRYGSHGSMSVDLTRGTFFDHENNVGGGVLDLIRRETAADPMEWLRQEGFIGTASQMNIAATYDYTDAKGALLYQAVRLEPKDFRQRHRDDRGKWVWGYPKGVKQVPYRLPQLLAAPGEPAFVVEGEKDADRLGALGLVATTNIGGANKWKPSLSPWFKGRTTFVIPDNDAPGAKHARAVAAALTGVAAEVRIVTLPDLPPKGDVSDWLDAGNGNDKNKLLELCRAAPVHEPADEAKTRPADLGRLLSATDHMARARAFRAARRPHLLHWRGEHLDWQGGRYRGIDAGDIRAEVRTFLDGALVNREGTIGPFLPDTRLTNETIGALEAIAHQDSDVSPPCWLDGRGDPPPSALISFPNGLLDWRAERLLPAAAKFFTQHACGFAYSADAAEPTQWLKFLDESFDGDDEEIATLQEIMGYLLTGDTHLQKMFLLVGPLRSGKGTITGVLRGLLAPGAVCGPTMASFAGEFGLQPLLGRQLAIIDDLRLGTYSDKSLITERLLSITGEGDLSVSRKYLSPWQGQIRIKFLIVSNEVPAFADDSGAIASRFVSLSTRRSFYGAEDLDLAKKLKAEWPGILLWALVGLRRLYQRGRFQSQRDEEMRGRLAAAASPVTAFIEACCVLDQGGLVRKDVLFDRYCSWAQVNKMPLIGNAQFGEALLAGRSHLITATRPVVNGKQVPHYKGIRLRTDADDRRERDAATFL